MAVAAVTGDHRRGKSALFLVACGWAGAAPHWLDPLRSLAPAVTLALLLGVTAFALCCAVVISPVLRVLIQIERVILWICPPWM